MGPGTATNSSYALPLPTSWGWTTGQPYQRLPKPAMNWYHASVKRVVRGVVNARRLNLNAQLCVHVKGSVHRHYNQ